MDIQLKTVFNLNEFKSYQKGVINYVLQNKNCIVIMPTGSGKSLCYQFPTLINNKITIVFSPLISIMEQQVNYLNSIGIKSKYYDSFDETSFISDILNYKIIYITPEKFSKYIYELNIIIDKIGLFAIDECHCLSEWGHDFRPNYKNLSLLNDLYKSVPIIALTATATNKVEMDIINILKLNILETVLIKDSVYRSNLQYLFRIKTNIEHDLKLLYKNESDKLIPTIIYANTVKQTETICDYLVDQLNIECLNYYAQMDLDSKKEIHELFMNNKIHCLVATVAYGMGIHKDNIRRIIHYGAPYSVEQYYQQTGRAGRDNENSQCILYFNNSDFNLTHFNMSDYKIKQSNDMYNLCFTSNCRNKYLLNYFNEENTIIHNCRCDNCILNESEIYLNLNNEIKLILKTIYLTKQQFGTGIIIDILRGSNKTNILSKKLNEINTYGKGKYKSIEWWKYLITYLQTKLKLCLSNNKYNILELTNNGIKQLYLNSSEIKDIKICKHIEYL